MIENATSMQTPVSATDTEQRDALSGRNRRPAVPGRLRPGGRAPRSVVTRESSTLLWLPAPALVVYAAFLLGPEIFAVLLSFVSWDGFGSPQYVGLGNWTSFFSTGTGRHAVVVSIEIVLLRWVFEVPIAIALGIFIAGQQRYRAVLSVFYVLPLLISGAGIGVMWVSFFDPAFGALRPVLHQQWLAEPVSALLIETAVLSWQTIPFYMLIFQASVRGIPPSLYEAASLDGAGAASQLRHITVPQLRYPIIAVTILSVTSSLTAFDTFFVMSNGGPAGATTNLSLGMYFAGFQESRLGDAAVFGDLLAILGFVLAAVISRLGGFGSMASQREGLS